MRRFPHILSLGALLIGATVLAACDPNHDWEVAVATGERQPDPGLTQAAILKALQRLTTGAETLALLEVEDRYGMAPGQHPLGVEPEELPQQAVALQASMLRTSLHERFGTTEFRSISPRKIDTVLAGRGPAASYSPETFRELEEDAGKTLFVRVILLDYHQDRTLEKDANPLNRHLYRETIRQQMTLRLAVQDASGAYLLLDQLEPSAMQESMFFDVPGDARELLETRSVPWLGPQTVWHQGEGEVRQGGSVSDLLSEINAREQVQDRASPPP